MSKEYPVFLTKTDSCVLVEIPDFGILTEGTDMENAKYMAEDAIKIHCESRLDANEMIPEPSEQGDLDITNAAFYEDGETTIILVSVE